MSKNYFDLDAAAKIALADKHDAKRPASFPAGSVKAAPAPAPAPVVEEVPVQEEAVAPEEYPLNHE